VAADDLEIRFIGQRTIENQNSIAVIFSAPIDGTQDFNRFMALFSENHGRVEGAWVLSEKNSVAYFTNIEAETNYEIQIRKGLRGTGGRLLKADKTHTLRTREAKAFISFAGQGYILPAQLAEGLPVSTLNVTAADLDFFRVREKSLVPLIDAFGERNQINYYDAKEIRRHTDLVYSARFDLPAVKNVLTPALLPLRDIPTLETPGVYLAVLRQAGSYPYHHAATYFTVSDMGLHLRAYAQAMEIQVQHLTTGAAMADVRIEVYDAKNNLIDARTSDADGRVSLPVARDKAHLALARKGGNVSILPLNVPALDLSAFELGAQPYRDPELFVYSLRDLYRPGETVILDGLLRDRDGRAANLRAPIAVNIKQPDNRVVKSFTWYGGALESYHHEYAIAADAPTGRYRAEFSLGGKTIQEYAFHVEDFMPERMKLSLDQGNPEPKRIVPDGNIAMEVKGEFLYGAPAGGHRVTCLVSMKTLREAVPQLPGFHFGKVDENLPGEFETEEIKLDDEGIGTIAVANQWKEIRSPLKIRLHTSLYESGGRPISRDKIYHMWPAPELVGLRPLWSGAYPDHDTLIEFEVVKTNAAGERLAAKDLDVTVIREYPDYYWEFSDGHGWERVINYQHYPVARQKLSIGAGKTGKISFPVEWGPYRVEVLDPKTNLTGSYRFSAGWSADSGRQGSRPDQVVLSLDKAAYRAGDAARVTIKAPEAGTALVTVEGDRLLWRKIVKVAAGGSQVEIPVAADWDRHDLYIAAMVIRPADQRQKIAPKRALGLIHLPLDRTQRRPAVTIAAPEKCRPNTALTVDLSVNGVSEPSELMASVAAVDVGVLSITDFKTPDPAGFFFNRRRYAVDSYDLYQKIIEGQDGKKALRRFGGDKDLALLRGGDKPMNEVQIVSLYRGGIKVGADGKARVTLDLPDFNGRLRIMAVVYGERLYGSAEREVAVAAPVVAEIAMPRFLALGDQTELVLDVQNLSGREQELTVALTVGKPLALIQDPARKVALKDKDKNTLRYTVKAGESIGTADIDLRITGIRMEGEAQPVTLQRRWRLGTRPAYPAVTRTWRRSLEPGQNLAIDPQVVKDLLPATVRAGLVITDRPPIDVAEHVRALYAYPYGCLEQTTSGIYPQIFLSQEMLERLKIDGDTPEARRRKVQQGIDRVLGLQKSDGGFGLWNSDSPEECWLTAYVSDFLQSAREQGYDVPQAPLAKAVERLQNYLRQPNIIQVRYSEDGDHTRFAVQAYSAYVLARLNQAPLGTLRTLLDNHGREARTGLPLVHLGLALDLQGDGRRARQALEAAQAIKEKKEIYLGDYGTPARDAAVGYRLLAERPVGKSFAGAWLVKLDETLRDRPWLSTQERNALVLAGITLSRGSGESWSARVKVGVKEERLAVQGIYQRQLGHDDLRDGLRIEVAGDRAVYATVTMNGYGAKAPAAERAQMEIRRSFYNLQGQPTDPRRLNSGDLLLVRLDVSSELRLADALVVDLLPAGLELENQNLATSFKIDALKVGERTIAQWHENFSPAHQEFRDDRYVAAVDIDPYEPVILFYLARAVTPGTYRVPNSYAEDMYRPYIHAVGETIDSITVKQK
jgi:uncharacterized protein YfaS (alpha-2-macroglobulin family)